MNRWKHSFQVKGDFIDGRFMQPPEKVGEITCVSPANLSDTVGKFPYSYQSVDYAVASAAKAFPAWRKTSFAEKAQYLKKYQEALAKRAEELTEAISREMGKPTWESKSEVTAMMGKVDITLADGMKYIADVEIPEIMPQTFAAIRFKPHGVMAVIGPFNFPGHLPNGHIVPALASGNTVVFKPSEKTPMVGQIMAECMLEAGFPAGVFNMVQGEKEVGRRLCIHSDVDGVLFTGSYDVGLRIKQDTMQQYWKILALEMGGKNSAIVWNDVDLDYAVHETLVGAFVTTGQRCSCTSRIYVHEQVVDAFVKKFHERAKAFKIGHPADSVFMGSLIDQSSVDRYLKFLGIAAREGCDVIMRGKRLETEMNGHYVSPSICVVKDSSLEHAKKSVYLQTELFAPNVSITPVNDLDQTISLVNSTEYGLVCSVFTKNKAVYEKCLDSARVGLLNWNRSTVGASSRLPFGGLGKSGNHFPSGVLAGRYCAYPVSTLEITEPKLNVSMPGLNWS